MTSCPYKPLTCQTLKGIFSFICICVFCHSIAFSCKKSLSKWVVRLGYFLAKSDVYTDTSIKQAIDVIKLNLILLLLKEHRQENRPFRHIERTTIIDEIASSKRPPSANRRKTKKKFSFIFPIKFDDCQIGK